MNTCTASATDGELLRLLVLLQAVTIGNCTVWMPWLYIWAVTKSSMHGFIEHDTIL